MKKKYKANEIVEEAKRLLPKVKTRGELVDRLAEKYNIAPGTANHYLTLRRFRTGFKRGTGLEKFWKDVKEGKREPPESTMPYKSLQFLAQIFREPTFVCDLRAKKMHSSSCFVICRNAGIPIRRFKIPGTFHRDGTKKFSGSFLYYFDFQKEEALDRIMALDPKLRKHKKGIKIALGFRKKTKERYKTTTEFMEEMGIDVLAQGKCL